MSAVATPGPIPGEVIDPPQKDVPGIVERLDDSAAAAAVGYRAFQRFSYAKASLLAAGTTYYSFLAMFSIVAFGYGVTALIGADEIASYLTEALSEAFPGLVGEGGIDPDDLRSLGQATSVIGLLALLYAGSGVMVAASSSIHLIYGAPPDPRNFVLARARLLGWFAVVGPLVMFSYVTSSVSQRFADQALDWLGITATGERVGLTVLAMLLAVALNFLVTWTLLGVMGGIRPPRQARLIAAGVGAVSFEILKYFMGLIITLSVDKPQYGAFAAPIAIMLVLYLQAMVLYFCAALAAGIATKDEPLAKNEPDDASDRAQT